MLYNNTHVPHTTRNHHHVYRVTVQSAIGKFSIDVPPPPPPTHCSLQNQTQWLQLCWDPYPGIRTLWETNPFHRTPRSYLWSNRSFLFATRAKSVQFQCVFVLGCHHSPLEKTHALRWLPMWMVLPPVQVVVPLVVIAVDVVDVPFLPPLLSIRCFPSLNLWWWWW